MLASSRIVPYGTGTYISLLDYDDEPLFDVVSLSKANLDEGRDKIFAFCTSSTHRTNFRLLIE